MIYHEINKACLGVSLRRFQQWFQQHDEDLRKVNKPKPKKERYQNKGLCQGVRNRFTAKQKVELIQQYDKAEAADSSLTVKAWCKDRSSLNYKGFLNWLKPMARKEIEIDAKYHRAKKSRCKDRSPHPSLLEDNSRGYQLYITVTTRAD